MNSLPIIFNELSLMKRFWRSIINRWRYLPLLDRWLLRELFSPLLFAIAAFTVVSISVGVMFELVRKIVESRQLDGQLKESSLTRAEVEIVIRAFVTVWRRMRHRRIPYPIPSKRSSYTA